MGADPSGTITFTLASGERGVARVTCMSAEFVDQQGGALIARAAGQVVSRNPPFPFVEFLGVDNGPPNPPQGFFDQAAVRPSSFGPDCPQFFFNVNPLESGNLVIRDDDPAPPPEG
jgi:hypothetical protein